jgi:hypothetical protein
MRDVAIDRSSTSVVRILSGGVVTVVGIALLLGGLFGQQIAAVGIGAGGSRRATRRVTRSAPRRLPRR